MNFIFLLVMFVPVAMAAPLYPEMSASSQKNLDRGVEDRNNPALVNLITTLSFQTSLIFLVYKWRIIFCALDPTTCGSSNVTPTNFHTYDTLDGPNVLAAANVITSNLSAQNVDALLNFMGLNTKNITSSIVEQAVQQRQKHLMFPVSKVTPIAQHQETAQHRTELETDTANPALNPYMPFSFRVIAPYSQYQWPMYRGLWSQLVSPSVRFR